MPHVFEVRDASKVYAKLWKIGKIDNCSYSLFVHCNSFNSMITSCDSRYTVLCIQRKGTALLVNSAYLLKIYSSMKNDIFPYTRVHMNVKENFGLKG